MAGDKPTLVSTLHEAPQVGPHRWFGQPRLLTKCRHLHVVAVNTILHGAHTRERHSSNRPPGREITSVLDSWKPARNTSAKPERLHWCEARQSIRRMTDSGALEECKVGHEQAAVVLHFHRRCFELATRMRQSHKNKGLRHLLAADEWSQTQAKVLKHTVIKYRTKRKNILQQNYKAYSYKLQTTTNKYKRMP